MRTDHSSLRWLTQMKEPGGQLARWLEKPVEYDFEIVHRPGRLHTNADALSHRPCHQSCPHHLQDPSSQQRTTSHQAVQCDLDFETCSLSPVAMETGTTTTTVRPVGVETCTATTTANLVGVSIDNPTNADTKNQRLCDKYKRDHTVF